MRKQVFHLVTMNDNSVQKISRTHDESGTILLISLFILSSILVASTIIANIIIREIRLGRDYQNAVVGFFTAESLIEESLYGLRIDQKNAADFIGTGSTPAGVTWRRDAYDTTTEFTYDVLQANDRIVITLYNRTNPNDAAGAESMQIEWKTGAFLEMSISEWDGQELILVTGTPLQFPCASKPCVAAVTSVLSTDKAYQITLQAKINDATDLRVTAYPSDSPSVGSEISVAAPITVISTAEYASTQQAIQITIARRLPWE